MHNQKISAFLNNCSLNTTLPSVLSVIKQLARHETDNTLDARITENSIYQNYLQLKTIFAGYYGLERPSTLSWNDFHRVLAHHSFFANEIIFAPVLRNFIALKGEQEGYDQDIHALRDIQDGFDPELAAALGDEVSQANEVKGRYSLLNFSEVVKLLHNHLGISARVFEYNYQAASQYTLQGTFVSDNTIYPFGHPPRLDLYLKEGHYETQPHEVVAAAAQQGVSEVDTLPDELKTIHSQITTYNDATVTNNNLGRLILYVHGLLQQQMQLSTSRITPALLAADFDPNKALLVPPPASTSNAVLTANENVTPGGNPLAEDPVAQPQPQTSQESVLKNKIDPTPDHRNVEIKKHILNAYQYAHGADRYFNQTPAGRQTFAVILLTILAEDERLQPRVRILSDLINKLSQKEEKKRPLSSYVLTQLIAAIIDTKANIESKRITKLVNNYQDYELALLSMNRISKTTGDINHKKLIVAARRAIITAWKHYHKQKDPLLIDIILATANVAAAPTEDNIRDYQQLRAQLPGKTNYGKIIGGLMLAVIGLAALVIAAVALVSTVGLAGYPAIGLTVGGTAALIGGLGLFKSGVAKGLYKETQTVDNTIKAMPGATATVI